MTNPTPYIEQLNKLRFLMLEVYKSEKSRKDFDKKLQASGEDNPYELLDYTAVLRFIDSSVTSLVTNTYSRHENWNKKLKFCNILYKITMDDKKVRDTMDAIHKLIKKMQ